MFERPLPATASKLLLALAILISPLLAPSTSFAASSYAKQVQDLLAAPPKTMHYPSAIEDEILDRLNRLRARKRLNRLTDRHGLKQAARAHSLRMLRDGFFAHDDPDRRGAGDRIAATDRVSLYRTVGENLAKIEPVLPDLAQRMHDGWVDSPGHYKNMIGKDFTHVGIGCARFRRETTCTQVFGGLAGTLKRPLPLTLKRSKSLRLSTSIPDLTYFGWELVDARERKKAEGVTDEFKPPRSLRGDHQLRVQARSAIVNRRYTVYTFFGPTIVLE